MDIWIKIVNIAAVNSAGFVRENLTEKRVIASEGRIED